MKIDEKTANLIEILIKLFIWDNRVCELKKIIYELKQSARV